LIGDGDQLNGKTILEVSTVPYSLSGNDFVIDVTFTDGSQGIYEGIFPQAVPEPSSVALLLVGIGAVFAHRLRARRVR
jgi:PEP-CTERM motif